MSAADFMNNLDILPKDKKRVVAKVLYKNGLGSRIVGRWLGISKDTVIRSSNISTPRVLRQYETEFEVAIKFMKLRASGLILRRIIELVPKEKNLENLVKAGNYFEGLAN